MDDLIGTEPGMAVFAVDQRIVEIGDMSCRLPDLRIHDDGRIDLDVVFDGTDEMSQPKILDVVLQQSAQGTVIPGIGKTSIDFASLIDKACALKMCSDFFECFLFVGHVGTSYQ